MSLEVNTTRRPQKQAMEVHVTISRGNSRELPSNIFRWWDQPELESRSWGPQALFKQHGLKGRCSSLKFSLFYIPLHRTPALSGQHGWLHYCSICAVLHSSCEVEHTWHTVERTVLHPGHLQCRENRLAVSLLLAPLPAPSLWLQQQVRRVAQRLPATTVESAQCYHFAKTY